MKPIFVSFRTKLMMAMVVLVVLSQMATVLAVLKTTHTEVTQRAGETLRSGARVLDHILDARESQLHNRVQIVAADPAFKAARAGREWAALEQVLSVHREQIGADLVLLLDRQGNVIASTEPREAGQPFAFPELWARAQHEGRGSALVVVNGAPSQFVLDPLAGGGWLGIGVPVDQAVAEELDTLTGLDLRFVVGPGLAPSPTGGLSETSSSRAGLGEITGLVAASLNLPLYTPDGLFLSLSRVLAHTQDYQITALLQISEEEVLAPYRRLKWQLLLIFGTALAVSLFLASFTAGAIGRPIQVLTEAARRIGRGESALALDLREKGEIGVLAHTLVSMQQDIAKREADLLYQSRHDVLTGLPNRAWAERTVHRLVAEGAPFALVRLSINDFKQINDTFGYAIGDEALIQTGQRLLAYQPEPDWVARIGGDEFLLILRDSLSGLKSACQEIRQLLSEPLQLEHSPVLLNVSLGVVVYPQHGTRLEELLRRSDIALNQAKLDSAHIFPYQMGLDETHLRQLTIIQNLQAAIDQNQLYMAYQPKVEESQQGGHAMSGQFEALIRWQHPTLGFVPPDEFIGLAERSGNIRALTTWVLDQVLRQIRQWSEQGERMRVAVNLSAHDLADESLPGQVLALCRRHQVETDQVVLEVTEGALMRDPKLTIRLLQELKNAGFWLSVDDFGTGYSSLAQLKQLPVDELKIDKSFVLKLDTNPEDEVIVRSTVELGHNLGLSVVAEGVENRASWNLLSSYGCDHVQGYYIAKPLPADQVLPWLLNYRQTLGHTAE